jgi:hypothetical protein
LAELPAVFAGDSAVESSSGLGSNVERAAGDRLTPKILFFGAGIGPDDVAKVSAAIAATAPDAKFVLVKPEEIQAAGGQGPDLDVISKVLKEKFAAV